MHYIMVSRGPTGPFKTNDLKAGRVDNIAKFIISVLFSSHRLFDNTATVVLYGPPRPPVSVTFTHGIRNLNPTEKEVAIALSKALSGSRFPGIFVEKAGIEKFIDGAVVLDEGGEDISGFEFQDGQKFILGDHLGFPDESVNHLSGLRKVSISPNPHTAFSVVSFLNIWHERKAFK